MKAYHLFEYQHYEPLNSLGYYLNKTDAEKEKLRLEKIQTRYMKRVAHYNSLSPQAQEARNYPQIPSEYHSGDIEIAEIEIITA